jgi:hypothetical protein
MWAPVENARVCISGCSAPRLALLARPAQLQQDRKPGPATAWLACWRAEVSGSRSNWLANTLRAIQCRVEWCEGCVVVACGVVSCGMFVQTSDIRRQEQAL